MRTPARTSTQDPVWDTDGNIDVGLVVRRTLTQGYPGHFVVEVRDADVLRVDSFLGHVRVPFDRFAAPAAAAAGRLAEMFPLLPAGRGTVAVDFLWDAAASPWRDLRIPSCEPSSLPLVAGRGGRRPLPGCSGACPGRETEVVMVEGTAAGTEAGTEAAQVVREPRRQRQPKRRAAPMRRQWRQQTP